MGYYSLKKIKGRGQKDMGWKLVLKPDVMSSSGAICPYVFEKFQHNSHNR